MFPHTFCSYSRYVTSSTPALASFRKPSKAAINAAGVSKCASERNRVVVCALASSDNRLSSVDMVARFRRVAMYPQIGTSWCPPLPSSGFRLVPVPHFPRCYGLLRPLHARPGGLRSPLTTRYRSRRRRGGLPRSWGIPLRACPGLGTPAVPRETRPSALGIRPSVGDDDVGFRDDEPISELNPRGPLPLRVYASPRRSPDADARLTTGLLATALTGLDSRQLDSIQAFYVLTSFLPCHAFVALHRRFSRASRSTNSRISRRIGGRLDADTSTAF